MAKYRATISFAGTITMQADEIRELDDKKQKDVIEDLLEAGYIVPADRPEGVPQDELKKESTLPPDKKAPAAQDDSAAEAAADEELAGDESEQTEDNPQAAENEQAVEEQPESDVVENETKRSKKK